MNVIFFLSILFSVLYFILVLIYAYGWIRTKTFIPSSSKPVTFVSVVVPARNEAQNISNLLQSLLQQDYPHELYEIIVVDDDSSDNTAAVVEALQKTASNLRLIRLKDEPGVQSYKKRAISKAIKHSKGSLIVTTDADCVMGEEWLLAMSSFYEKEQAKMIVAPVAFYEEKNMFEKIQSLEFSGLMAITAGSIHWHSPLMCNGANLAYEKEAFTTVGGFEGIDHLVSGDDVLLMQKIHKVFPSGIRYLKSPQAIVRTRACGTLYSFIQQRIRWASKAAKADSFHSFIPVFIVSGINTIALCLLLLGIYNVSFINLFTLIIIGKCFIDFLLLLLSTAFFKKSSFLIFLIPAQLFYYLYIVVVGVFAILGKYHWKGREVKGNQ